MVVEEGLEDCGERGDGTSPAVGVVAEAVEEDHSGGVGGGCGGREGEGGEGGVCHDREDGITVLWIRQREGCSEACQPMRASNGHIMTA